MFDRGIAYMKKKKKERKTPVRCCNLPNIKTQPSVIRSTLCILSSRRMRFVVDLKCTIKTTKKRSQEMHKKSMKRSAIEAEENSCNQTGIMCA